MGLQVEVSDSNAKSPALKRPLGAIPGADSINKESPIKDVWLIRYLALHKSTLCSFYCRTYYLPVMSGTRCKLSDLASYVNRHGESEHNTTSDWGIRDPGLTKNGWKQVSFDASAVSTAICM